MNLHKQNFVCWPSVGPQDIKQTYIHTYKEAAAAVKAVPGREHHMPGQLQTLPSVLPIPGTRAQNRQEPFCQSQVFAGS